MSAHTCSVCNVEIPEIAIVDASNSEGLRQAQRAFNRDR